MKNATAKKLRQVPEEYLVAGIDLHKMRHAAAAITQDLATRAQFKLDNSREGFEIILRRAWVEMVESGCHSIILAIETEGPLLAQSRLLSQ